MGNTICDSLVGSAGELAYAMLLSYLTDIIFVRETWIRRAVKHLIKKEKNVVEGAGVIAAAIMDDLERIGGKNVALIMTGGNIYEDLKVQIPDEN